MNHAYKKIVLVVAIILVFAFFFVFRQRISQFLSVKKDETSGREPPPISSGIVIPPSPIFPPETSKISPPTAQKSKIPEYTGREPGEVRPVPEEVKLFSDAQRLELYANIRRDAEILRSAPTFFDGWIHLGLLKKVIGDFEGARDAWEFAGVIQSLNSTSFANLGELYWRYLHDYPKSEANFRISIKNKPDPLVYISLAELYHYSYKEKADLADDVLLEGLGVSPGDENLTKRLAYLYEQRGEIAKALEWWEKVFKFAPDDKEVQKTIETLKIKLGKDL